MVKAKVLVVDEEERAYESLKSGLSEYGYEVHTTTTTFDALSLAGAHDYKAALVALTSIHDATFLSGLQVERPGIPVIVVCSAGAGQIPSSVIKRVDHALGKPLQLDPVRLMLDRALEVAVLRARLRQQRENGCHGWLPEEVDADGLEGAERAGAASLDEVLVRKLRTIVPNMEVLGRGALHRAVLSYVEKLLLTIVLTECRGNQVKSADILGINRNTLRKKLREFGISPRRHS